MALGGRTVAEWQSVMSADEFLNWGAFYQIEPFGEYRHDLRTALVARTVAAGYAKDGNKLKLNDFLIKFDAGEEHVLTPDEMIAFVKGFGKTHG